MSFASAKLNASGRSLRGCLPPPGLGGTSFSPTRMRSAGHGWSGFGRSAGQGRYRLPVQLAVCADDGYSSKSAGAPPRAVNGSRRDGRHGGMRVPAVGAPGPACLIPPPLSCPEAIGLGEGQHAGRGERVLGSAAAASSRAAVPAGSSGGTTRSIQRPTEPQSREMTCISPPGPAGSTAITRPGAMTLRGVSGHSAGSTVTRTVMSGSGSKEPASEGSSSSSAAQRGHQVPSSGPWRTSGVRPGEAWACDTCAHGPRKRLRPVFRRVPSCGSVPGVVGRLPVSSLAGNGTAGRAARKVLGAVSLPLDEEKRTGEKRTGQSSGGASSGFARPSCSSLFLLLLLHQTDALMCQRDGGGGVV